jgi:hypothetical protein
MMVWACTLLMLTKLARVEALSIKLHRPFNPLFCDLSRTLLAILLYLTYFLYKFLYLAANI